MQVCLFVPNEKVQLSSLIENWNKLLSNYSPSPDELVKGRFLSDEGVITSVSTFNLFYVFYPIILEH
jgi:hypothetical protein